MTGWTTIIPQKIATALIILSFIYVNIHLSHFIYLLYLQSTVEGIKLTLNSEVISCVAMERRGRKNTVKKMKK